MASKKNGIIKRFYTKILRKIDPDYDEIISKRHEVIKKKIELEKKDLEIEEKRLNRKLKPEEHKDEEFDEVEFIREEIRNSDDMSTFEKAMAIFGTKLIPNLGGTQELSTSLTGVKEEATPPTTPHESSLSPEEILSAGEQLADNFGIPKEKLYRQISKGSLKQIKEKVKTNFKVEINDKQAKGVRDLATEKVTKDLNKIK